MYRRMNGFLAIMVFLLMLLIVPAWALGFDGGGGLIYTSGHTHGGNDSIGPGAGGIVVVESVWWGTSLMVTSYTHKYDGARNKSEEDFILSPYFSPTIKLTDYLGFHPLIGPSVRVKKSPVLGLQAGAALDYRLSQVTMSPRIWLVEERHRNYYGIGVIMKVPF